MATGGLPSGSWEKVKGGKPLSDFGMRGKSEQAFAA